MSQNIQAIRWALLATALFAGVSALAKLAVTDYHVLQILFFRQIIVLLSALPTVIKTFPHSLRTKHPGLHGLRLLGAFVALSTSIWAVAVLPLTTATTLSFAKVFFVALLALWFLGEPVGRHRLLAVLAGFIGVLVVMRPGQSGFADLNALIPVVGALGAAIAVTSVRRLSQTESAATLLAYQALFVGVMAGVPLIWLWQTPDWRGLLLLVSMGLLATAAQWAGLRALHLGEASVIGPIEYMTLIYAAILGFALFGELPDGYTLLGAAIIVGSSGYMMMRESRVKRL